MNVTKLMATALAVAVLSAGVTAMAEEKSGSRERHEQKERSERGGLSAASNSAAFATYQKECGSCHTPFPPGFLPTRSWDALMDGLGKHFGDNAELSAESATTVRAYLHEQAADASGGGRRGERAMQGLSAGDAPLRLTETSYFKRVHRELPKNVLSASPQIKSFANCQACHPRADKGVFDEDEVKVPGMKNFERD